MPRTTVYSVLKRWKDIGSIEDDEDRGRKSSLSIQQESMITKEYKNDRTKPAA